MEENTPVSAGCGAQPFLQLYEDFEISPRVFSEQPCAVLFERGK